MLNFVYYLHWFLMGLVGLATVVVVLKPRLWARVVLTIFLAQQLILDGCIMTIWENSIKVGMGYGVKDAEFVLAHFLPAQLILPFKILFITIIAIQLYEIKGDKREDNERKTVRQVRRPKGQVGTVQREAQRAT